MTAVSLATTLSLSVKVRLQTACMESNRPLNRLTAMLLMLKGVEVVFTALSEQDTLLFYSEILTHFHSLSTNSRHCFRTRELRRLFS